VRGASASGTAGTLVTLVNIRSAVSVLVLAALAASGCSSRREAPTRYGTARVSVRHYERPAVAWAPATSPALREESEAARVALEAGMIDARRASAQRCGSTVGWVVGAVVVTLDGQLARADALRCEGRVELDELARSARGDEAALRDPVARALLLRAGVDEALLASAPLAVPDRWSTARLWASRLWIAAVQTFGGVARGQRSVDDRAARTYLAWSRDAIGAFERSGAVERAVMDAFPFARLAQELDDQQWLRAAMRRVRLRAIEYDTSRFASIAISGWSNDEGNAVASLRAPAQCSDEARAVRALRYRPTAAWFSAPDSADVLTTWRAFEGLLQRLGNGGSLTRTILPPCDAREFVRPARGYEVAYVFLAAMVGYDALAPDEYARFVAGDRRLLAEIETRFRERIQQIGGDADALARVQLDQRATEVLWVRAARTLAEFHRRRGADASPTSAMRRNRDAARVLAAARNTDRSGGLQRCELLATIPEIDRDTAREHGLGAVRALLEAPEGLGDKAALDCVGDLLERYRAVDRSAIDALVAPLSAAVGARAQAVGANRLLAALAAATPVVQPRR
jgi:hypothetical protein